MLTPQHARRRRRIKKIAKTITTDAPIDDVFNYVHGAPSNLPDIWPSLVDVEDVERLPNGGTRFRCVYSLRGMRFEGTIEDIEYVPNQRCVSEARGGIQIRATYTWTYEPENSGTKLNVQAEYAVPIPVLGRLAEAPVVKVNEREMDWLLANLKAKMEA
jgi:hypothetical protein